MRVDGSGAVLGLRSGLFALDFESGETERMAEPPFDPRTHRFNESGVDPAGRLWLGTMFDPEPGVDAEPEAGPLVSWSLSEGLVIRDASALTANGFAWSADGGRFYLAHTVEGWIEAIDFDAATGALGARRRFVSVDPETGQPDGGTIDAEGFYWSAIHKGGRLHRYAPDGRLDCEVALPIRNPTMMAFAGEGLDALYVTSATHGKEGAPHEGGLWRLDAGVRGLPLPTLAA